MFYPMECLRRGGTFYLCWVADSYPMKFKKISLQQLWSQDIRDLCNALNEVIVRESGFTSNRFSLRLSAQLIRGLARLYLKKVDILMGNLYMMNAHILRRMNNKFEFHERSARPQHFPKVVIRELTDENEPEEQIQNTGNVIARIEDITLQEEVVLPRTELPDWGFGEENADQVLQMINSCPVEEMVAGGEAAGQISEIDITNLQAQDMERTRDNILIVQADVHMERISDTDINLFKRSLAVSELVQNEAEIPPIPDIQPQFPATVTELPVPESEIEKDTDSDQNKAGQIYLEFKELEALDVEEFGQRRKKQKQIIDKKICFQGDYMRSRLADVNIETRHELFTDCVVNIHRIPAANLMREAGPRFTRASHIFTEFYVRNLGYKRISSDMEIQDFLGENAKKRKRPTLNLERIEEETVTPKGTVVPAPEDQLENPVPQGQSTCAEVRNKERDRKDSGKRMSSEGQCSPSKKPKLASPKRKNAEKQGEMEPGTQEVAALTRQLQDIQLPQIYITDQTQNISQMIEAVGLADMRSSIKVHTEEVCPQRDAQRKLNDSDETPLGSLDRTKVSLGDSDKTTMSMKMILEQWGTEGTITRIAKLFSQGIKKVTFDTLLKSGPSAPPGRARIVAARCFASLLKLKQHGFVTITKKPGTLDINTISLADKCLQ